jgi:antitoxin (DNA-binding transcriptional repressor) of toxin-antitoxin stability system
MEKIKAVGVKALKDQLSAYLREVQAGTVILVTDRGHVIAELREPSVGRRLEEGNSLEQEWIREGTLIPPRTAKVPITKSPVRLREGTAQRILDEERGQ